MVTAAKFPAALVTLANLLGEYPSIPANELTLNADITSGALSIVATGNIPSTWPQPGSLTIDSEVILYDSFTAATFTVNAAGRGTQIAYGASAAAPHTAGATIGLYTTAQAMNQILAEIIAIETQLLAGQSNPNLILNPDFGRRTVYGLAMPENFTDLSGTTKIDAGAAGSVSGNIFTQGAANNEYAWCAGSFVWREGRALASFKAVAVAGIYELRWRVDATHYVSAKQNNGNFTIALANGGAPAVQATTALALTLNNWYYLELDINGTFAVARLYSEGVAATYRSASTISTTLGAQGTVNLGVNLGAAHISITSDQANAQWGGFAGAPTQNYPVQVETWLPESHPVTFGGTLGGQAIGYDDSAAAGPVGKAWALRAYTPAASRTMSLNQSAGALPWQVPSVPYTLSYYGKTSGYGGSGALLYTELNGMGAVQWAGADTTWTRKSITNPSPASATAADIQINVNATATGTCWVMCGQYEQGSALTAWRNAPSDDAPMWWHLATSIASASITNVTPQEVDSRDLAINLFMPWDGVITITPVLFLSNGGLNQNLGTVFVDGAGIVDAPVYQYGSEQQVAAKYQTGTWTIRARVAAGKHRVAVKLGSTAGTISFSSNPSNYMEIMATRGK